jgi:hypothetical protein
MTKKPDKEPGVEKKLKRLIDKRKALAAAGQDTSTIDGQIDKMKDLIESYGLAPQIFAQTPIHSSR